jgi:pyruvate dehydrogenase kinase 2/3/4
MQQLPYVVVTNQHMNAVYDLYYTAFDTFRRVPEVKTLADNNELCGTIADTLKAHLSVIPKLAMGVLESSGLMEAEELDNFMNTILKSVSSPSLKDSPRSLIALQRISRRVIAEQHLALTETFHAPWFSPGAKLSETEFIGEVFLKCMAAEVISRCGEAVQALARSAYGPDVAMPQIKVVGHLEANFPYILSHIEYIIGELLRNSVSATIEKQMRIKDSSTPPPPIEVTICESQQHVIIRVSDQGGGISRDILPYLWSFSKGPYSQRLLENLEQVPRMSATLQELREEDHPTTDLEQSADSPGNPGSLSTLSRRPPNLRLGMGLPLSRVYAEYWAGSLELHSLEGYGVDAFLQISKLGNKNEQLTTRASMDAV